MLNALLVAALLAGPHDSPSLRGDVRGDKPRTVNTFDAPAGVDWLTKFYAPMSQVTSGFPTTSAAIVALGLPAPAHLWLASDPLKDQITQGACTSVLTPVTNTTPFCAPGVTPTTCSYSINPSPSVLVGASFDNPIAQPGTGSMSACVLMPYVYTAYLSFLAGTQDQNHLGWNLQQSTSGYNCVPSVMDGTNYVRVLTHDATDPTKPMLCCMTVDTGAAHLLSAFVNGAADGTNSIAGLGTLTNSEPFTVGLQHNSGYWSAGAPLVKAWYWSSALSAANMAALWTSASTTGLGTTMPAGVPAPSLVWDASRPYVNSINIAQAAHIKSSTGTTVDAYLSSIPVCGSAQNTGNCLQSQVFGSLFTSNVGTFQAFNCGQIGDSNGTVSPTNDWSLCAVARGGSDVSGMGGQVVSKSNTGAVGGNGWSMGPMIYENSDVSAIVPTGILVEGGPTWVRAGDWYVGCLTYEASNGGSPDESIACAYQNGLPGKAPGAHECDDYGKFNTHSTAAFTIGGLNGVGSFSGEIAEVVYWAAHRLTRQEVYTFSERFVGADVQARTKNATTLAAQYTQPELGDLQRWTYSDPVWFSWSKWWPIATSAGVYIDDTASSALKFPLGLSGFNTVWGNDPTNSYPNTGIVDSGAFTKPFRVKVTWTPNATSVSAYSTIWCLDDGTTSNQICLKIDTSKRFVWMTNGNADIVTAAQTLVAGTPFTLDFVGDYAKDKYTLKVNGAVAGSSTTARTSPTGLAYFRLGADETGASQLVGGSWISEVKIQR